MSSAIGCGVDYPATAPVRGKITIGQNPVTTGRITFYPEQGRPASAQIESDGSYTLTTFKEGDGALLGEHHVTIMSASVETKTVDMPKSFSEERERRGRPNARTMSKRGITWLVPEKYAHRDSSPLTATVTADSNVINFDL